jgi:hypothetical protein
MEGKEARGRRGEKIEESKYGRERMRGRRAKVDRGN